MIGQGVLAEANQLFQQGVTLIFKEDDDKAISLLNKALEINPHMQEAYFKRGNCYMNKGQYDQAMDESARCTAPLSNSQMIIAISGPERSILEQYLLSMTLRGVMEIVPNLPRIRN